MEKPTARHDKATRAPGIGTRRTAVDRIFRNKLKKALDGSTLQETYIKTYQTEIDLGKNPRDAAKFARDILLDIIKTELIYLEAGG